MIHAVTPGSITSVTWPPPTSPGPPSQPPKPTVSNIHSSSVKLRWGAPTFDGTSPVTSYEIESLQEGFGEWHQIAQNSRNSYVVKTLEQNTSYVFRIVALNEYGASKPSEQSDCVVTKTKGWLVSSPSIHKKPVHPELGRGEVWLGCGYVTGGGGACV